MKFTTYLAENMFDGTEDKQWIHSVHTAVKNVYTEFFDKLIDALGKIEHVEAVRWGGPPGKEKPTDIVTQTQVLYFKYHRLQATAIITPNSYKCSIALFSGKDKDSRKLLGKVVVNNFAEIDQKLQKLVAELWKTNRAGLLDV